MLFVIRKSTFFKEMGKHEKIILYQVLLRTTLRDTNLIQHQFKLTLENSFQKYQKSFEIYLFAKKFKI